MSNVFTKRSRFPRSQSLLDYSDLRERSKNNEYDHLPKVRILSPTRRGNPHPLGLHHQNIPTTPNYFIWNPDFAVKETRYAEMTKHIRSVNFSCKHPEKFNYVKRRGQCKDLVYTENTISRISYSDPDKLPELKMKYKLMPPQRKPITGIVPNMPAYSYLPVIEK